MSKCDALLTRCAEIRKTFQWDAVEKLKEDAIDWFRQAGLQRTDWWEDLDKLVLARDAHDLQTLSWNLRFAEESGVMGGSLYKERFLRHHMDAALKIQGRLEAAREQIETRSPQQKGPRVLSELDKVIVATERNSPASSHKEICCKVDVAFEKAKREVPLPRGWKRRDPNIRSMKDAYVAVLPPSLRVSTHVGG